MSSIPIQFISKKASGYEGFSSGLELTDDSNLEYPEEDALYQWTCREAPPFR